VPYTDSWQVGLQRALDRNTVVEARYVGNHNACPWTNENWNQVNIYENNFYNEFKLAQSNLRANVLAGRASDGFRYTGHPRARTRCRRCWRTSAAERVEREQPVCLHREHGHLPAGR
jgi:hypothetical protein